MTDESIPKCCGFVTLSASVILPSDMKSVGDCMRNANKSSKIRYSAILATWKSDPANVNQFRVLTNLAK